MSVNASPSRRVNPVPGAGIGREARASWAFVERNFYLVRRYWHLELAFLVFNVTSAMSVLYIGEAQMQRDAAGAVAAEQRLDLVLYLGIGTVVWAYLRAVFGNVGEMVAWERWEGTIEYTMMAPVSRLTHMLGVSLFSIIYGLARSALLLGVLALFFRVDLSRANLGGSGAGAAGRQRQLYRLRHHGRHAAAALPGARRGDDLRHLLAAAGRLRRLLPGLGAAGLDGAAGNRLAATYVLDGMRATILEGAPTLTIGPYLMPTLLLGAVSVPLGLAVFGWAERYAKRTGRLKRSG
jgi:ABC-2 type transport system permease protein